MRWIGIFNIAYGGLGLAAAVYLGRMDGVALCLWVMLLGALLRSRRFRAVLTGARRALGDRLRTVRRT